MQLYLSVESDENYKFYEIFDRLSPLRKRIWKKITEKSRAYNVFKISQSKLATWCFCSRSAISEAFALFKSFGWMWLESTGWKRPKTINIPISKRQMDLDKKQYFHRVQATYTATLTTSTRKCITSTTGSQNLGLKIAPHLEKVRISEQSKLKLSLVEENYYHSALERAKAKHAKGELSPERIERYVVGTALNMAKTHGQNINWPGYYQSMKSRGEAK